MLILQKRHDKSFPLSPVSSPERKFWPQHRGWSKALAVHCQFWAHPSRSQLLGLQNSLNLLISSMVWPTSPQAFVCQWGLRGRVLKQSNQLEKKENNKASVLDSLSAPFSGAAASFGDCLIAIIKWITV